jgi:hypothetical protein
MIKADTCEELYIEAAQSMLRGFVLAGKALKMKNGRWCALMLLEY